MLGKKIRSIRKSKNLTIKELAKLVGLSEQAISQYEREVREPSLEKIDNIAKALETTREELLQTTYNINGQRVVVHDEVACDQLNDDFTDEMIKQIIQYINISTCLSDEDYSSMIVSVKEYIEFLLYKKLKEIGGIQDDKEKI